MSMQKEETEMEIRHTTEGDKERGSTLNEQMIKNTGLEGRE